MPPDPVGRRERSRARPPPLGPVRCSRGYRRAPLLRCPQPPSAGVSALNARPPPAVGAGVFGRAPSVLARFAGCALRDAPRPRRAWRLAAPATLQACGGVSLNPPLPGNVCVAGMARRRRLAVFIGLLAVGGFMLTGRHQVGTVAPPQAPHGVIVPRLGPRGVFCFLAPSGSPRCSQEPPWRRQPSPLLRPISTTSN